MEKILDPYKEKPGFTPTERMEGMSTTDVLLVRIKEYMERIMWTLDNIHITLHWMQPPERRKKQREAQDSYREIVGKKKNEKERKGLEGWKKKANDDTEAEVKENET